MAASDEDQVRSMLEAMGVSSIEESAPQPAAAPEPVAVPPAAAVAAPPVQAAAPKVPEAIADVRAELTHDAAHAAVSAAAERRAAGAVPGGREVPVSTVVHLLGLPTATQLSMLEGKIDILTTRVTSITSKLDRIASELALIKNDATTDRIDFQLNDIRGLLRRLVPKAAAAGDVEPVPESPRLQNAKARILSSAPPAAGAAEADKKTPAPAAEKKEAKKDEKDALEEFQVDDGTFQANEGRRVRQEMK